MSDLSALHLRQDKDKDRINNEPYKMKAIDGKNDEKDMANVTLPIGQLYIESAISNLISVTKQTVVSGKKPNDKETTKVEEFLDDLNYEIDKRLTENGESEEFATLADYVCSRGSAAEMNLLRVDKDGEFIADVRPIDTRWFAWEFGKGGLAWGAPTYNRTKGDIQAEFDITIRSAEAEVVDLWTPDWEYTWVDGKLVRDQANDYGFVPIVFQGVAVGSALREKNSIQYKWDSIFHSSRELFDEANFIATVIKTQNYSANKPPLQLPNPSNGVRQAELPFYPGAGDIASVEIPLQPVNVGDLKQYTVKYQEIINTLISQATFNSIDLGDIPFPLSAVAISRLSTNRNKMQYHRLLALNQILQRSSAMRIRQVIGLAQTVKLGELGHQREYKPQDLEGEYSIKYRFYSLSSEDIAAQGTISNVLGSLVSEDYKRREILHLSDPDGEKQKQRAELAESVDPVIGLIEQGLSLIEQSSDDSDIKVRRIYGKIIGILKQEKLAETQPLNQDIERGSTAPQNPTQSLALYGGNDSTRSS